MGKRLQTGDIIPEDVARRLLAGEGNITRSVCDETLKENRRVSGNWIESFRGKWH